MSIRKANKLINPQGYRVRRIQGNVNLIHPDGSRTAHTSAKEAVTAAEHFRPFNEQEVA